MGFGVIDFRMVSLWGGVRGSRQQGHSHEQAKAVAEPVKLQEGFHEERTLPLSLDRTLKLSA